MDEAIALLLVMCTCHYLVGLLFMCTSRGFGGTDACGEIAILVAVREIGCTCRLEKTTDACG